MMSIAARLPSQGQQGALRRWKLHAARKAPSPSPKSPGVLACAKLHFSQQTRNFAADSESASHSLRHLRAALATWQRFNKAGAEPAEEAMDSLVSLKEIGMTRQWDYSLPTFCPTQKVFQQRQVFCSNGFKAALFLKFPWLSQIDFTNLVLQGGAILDIMTGREKLNDLDFFVVGLDSDAALARIESLMQEIVQMEKKYIESKQKEQKEKAARYGNSSSSLPVLSELYAVRKGNSITVHANSLGTPLSVGMTCFKSVAHGLYSTDLSASGICYDGETVWCTPLCAFSIQNMSILVSPQLSRSAGDAVYERRLSKYFEEKGFDLILPDFDLNSIKLPHKDFGLSEVVEMPHLLVQVKNVSKSKVLVDKLIVKSSLTHGAFPEGESYYSEADKVSSNVHAETFYTNLEALVTGTDGFDFVAQGERISNVLFTCPRLSNRQIEVCYDALQEQIYPSPNQFDATKICKYYCIPEASLARFVQEIYLRCDDENEAIRMKRIRKWIATVSELQKTNSAAELEKMRKQLGQSKIRVRLGDLGKSLQTSQEWYGQSFLLSQVMWS